MGLKNNLQSDSFLLLTDEQKQSFKTKSLFEYVLNKGLLQAPFLRPDARRHIKEILCLVDI